MCGGALDIQDGSSVAVCSFCGTKQTIPKLDNETRVNLYDRANHFRRNNDYDKAMSIYEQLLAADKTDAEAYWSIVLCKYGIEYVEDPKTRKMVPTINRAQYTSIFADEDYKSALRYADGYQRTIYETEAKELDKIQKGILAISQKEEPFDVFICYKETDSYGRRTHDSVLAQDLYFQLKQEGFKVFFSRITLEDKLGVAYEPYIFAALNTAKVMVVVGTSKENLNAVWVKNEWSRFLALIKKDSSKVLIPAYRDMDPYDLPEEFSHLQAQDMSKLGFMQDLIRGIKKIARTTKPQQTVVVEKVGSAPANTDALIKRAFLFLEDGDWTTANKYAERVLDNNPECSKAYLVKLLAELNIRKPELLSKFNKNLLDYSNFKKAVRFADSSEREVLANYNKDVANNIKQAANERVYSVALKRVAVPSNEKDLKQSIADLRSISGYKDADTKAVELEKRLENFLKKKREAEEKARIKAEEEKIRKERLAEEKRERARKHKKIGLIVIGVSVFLAVLSILTVVVFVPMGQMDKADKLFSEGRLEDAMTIYKEQYDTEEGEAKYKTAKAVQALSSSYATTSTHYSNIQYILSYGMDVKINYSHDLFEEDITGQKEDKWIVYQSKGSWEVDGMPTPIKPGYYFVSWKFVGYGMDYKDRIELTFEPTWTPANYHITYNLMGGTNASKNPTKYTIETESFMISNPTREGYIFEGWTSSTIDAPTKGVIIKQGTIGNITLTAHWSAADYVIYLDARGGSGVSSSVNVKYGRSYTLPTPTKLGYTFIGWCQRDNDQFMTQAGTWQRTSNLHLYAVWEEITYNITYDLDGGFLWLPNPSTYTISTSTSITREPTKTGYTFLGWTHANLQTPTKNLIIEAGNTGNITLTANWQVNTYTITYDANGGEVSPATQNVVYGTEYTLARPTREGYDFGGWLYNDAIQADGVWSLTTSPTFVAQWTAISYSISYELNGGSVVLWVNPTSYTIESSKTIHNPTKTGYTFLGWTYEGQTTPVTSATIPVGSTGDKYYIANWQANTYTIAYDANGGEISLATQDVVYGTEYTLATPTREGYDFGGWLYNDTIQTDGMWSLTTSPTFVAQWTARTDVAYVVNHYQENANNSSYTLLESQNLEGTADAEIVPARRSYAGFTSPAAKTVKVKPNGTLVVDYYYTRNLYTINFVTNGGETISSIIQKYESAISLPNACREGVTFGGWFDDINLSNQKELTTMPIDGIILYAYWTEENKPSDFTYSGTSAITINSYVGTSTTMRVPEHIGGLPVTTIASSAFANKTTMVEAVVPNTVTSMGSAAFKGCSALESITIPFVGLSEDSSARYGLFGIMFNDPSTSSPGSNIKQSYSEYDSYYFNVPESIRKVVVTKQDFVSSGAFNNWNFIEEIWYHQIIDTIGYSAFSGCSALKKISCGANGETSMILNAVKIRGKAFAECASLEDICQQEKTTIAFSDAINEIEYEAFRNAKFIVDAKKIVVPNSATIIGNGAFEGAASLEEIVIPFIGTADDAYQEDAVFGAIFGYSERYEEGTVCQNYMGFSNYCNYYYIPQTIKRVTLTNESGISNGAFNNCSSLTSITILSSVTRIGDMSFSGCSSLTSIVIPDSVTTIGDEAFKNCSDLTSIAIPDKVTSIGRRAFENCSSLTSVAFEDPNGWYVSTSSGATSGTDLTLADAETNATHLKSTYYDYYWYKL